MEVTNGTSRTVCDEVLEVVREMPWVSAKDVADLMPHQGANNVSATLTFLHAKGELIREASGTPNRFGRKPYLYSINPDPKPNPPKMRRKHPTAAGYEARIAELEAKVTQLTQWKADAINRFPDLGVDPITAEARRIVAAELDKTDTALAQQVRAGLKDGILPMRVTVAALQR